MTLMESVLFSTFNLIDDYQNYSANYCTVYIPLCYMVLSPLLINLKYCLFSNISASSSYKYL